MYLTLFKCFVSYLSWWAVFLGKKYIEQLNYFIYKVAEKLIEPLMAMADMEQLKQFCKGSNICLKEITYHNLTLFYQLSFCQAAPNFNISTIVNYFPHSSFSSSQYTRSSYLKLF